MRVSGLELRVLADAAHDEGQEELSMKLHDLAREQEAVEHSEEGRAA